MAEISRKTPAQQMNKSLSIQGMARTSRSSSLYNRILLIMGVIFAFMAIIIATGILLFVNEHENVFWYERQTEAVHNAAEQVSDYIKDNESAFSWLSRFGFDEMLEEQARISSFLVEYPAFMEIAFLDASGKTLASGAKNSPILANQFTVRQSQWFRMAKAGQKNYSRIQTSPRGESYMIFAMPFQENGVAVAQINMDGLWKEVAGITFGKSGTVYIASREGQIIAHQNSQFVLSNRNIGNSLQFHAILQAEGNEYSGIGENLTGDKVRLVSARIKSTDWIVIAELPAAEAHETSSNALLYIPLGLLSIITASAVIFRLFLRREFLVPIEQLRNGALRLSKGDLSFRHKIAERRDELCQVMEVFNTMACELQGRHAEQRRHALEIADAYQTIQGELIDRQKAEAALQNLNNELEQRVQERTETLQKMNADLQHEIAERKLAEEQRQNLETQLQQAQKMEAIGTLAGGIAHDFNNILGAIIGYAEMIKEDCPEDSSTYHDINQVLQAGNRAKDLVKQILAFSRQAKADRIALQPARIIKEALKLLRSSIPTTIAIKQNIDPEAGSILADPTQIHQIIMNLCTNAFHAMERTGGTLTISLNRHELAEDDQEGGANFRKGRCVRLSISDTGVGIAPENMEKIFDPYFTTKEVGKGTGMGLAMVHGIVRSCGGSISCESRPGEGTVFHIILPALEEHALEEIESNEPAPRGTEHILLVDDEKILLDMGRLMLERLGYQVTPKANGVDALAAFQHQPETFDIIITDQTMPGMTGVDLAKHILAHKPGMPIILCTGYSTLISEEEAQAIGIQGFAMKPLARKFAAELIRKLLDGK